MVQDGSVPLNFLRKAAEPLKENNKAGLLVAEVLHAASHREGHKKLDLCGDNLVYNGKTLCLLVM